MDALAGLVDGPRAKGAFLLRALMSPPWSVHVRDEAPLTLLALTAGEAYVLPAGGGPERLAPGDIALLRGPAPYTVADDPATPPGMIIGPGQECAGPDGRDLGDTMGLGVRAWGNDPDGDTAMLIGTYRMRGEIGRRLLDTLPPLAVLRDFDTPLLGLLAAETAREAPGQEVVLDRLLDLLLIEALRHWLADPAAAAPSWYRAHADPVVGRALCLMHAEPARPWTVAGLAAAVGVSRATFARRFGGLVGRPPMSYLAELRLDLAADRLRDPAATVGAVARGVGYATAFALSTAFKRARGESPREFRRRVAAG